MAPTSWIILWFAYRKGEIQFSDNGSVNRELTQATTADLSLLESNLVVAQGQRHRAGRDTSIQIRLIENLSDLRRPMRNGVAGRASEAFPRFPAQCFQPVSATAIVTGCATKRGAIARPEKTYKRHRRRPASMPEIRAVRLARARQTAEYRGGQCLNNPLDVD